MINGVKTVDEILELANVKTEDSQEASTLYQYLNLGITAINAIAELKLPQVPYDKTHEVYEVSDEDFVNNMMADILMNFVAKEIFQTDGYDIETNVYYREYVALLNMFQSKFKHLIKDDYKLTLRQNGSVRSLEKPNPNPSLLRRTKLW